MQRYTEYPYGLGSARRRVVSNRPGTARSSMLWNVARGGFKHWLGIQLICCVVATVAMSAEMAYAVETSPADQHKRIDRYGTDNPSVRALVDTGRANFADGNYEIAALTIERALRIEPENPVLWHQLARCRYQLQSFDEAANLSRRSNTYGAEQPVLVHSNNMLIEASIRAQQGDVRDIALIQDASLPAAVIGGLARRPIVEPIEVQLDVMPSRPETRVQSRAVIQENDKAGQALGRNNSTDAVVSTEMIRPIGDASQIEISTDSTDSAESANLVSRVVVPQLGVSVRHDARPLGTSTRSATAVIDARHSTKAHGHDAGLANRSEVVERSFALGRRSPTDAAMSGTIPSGALPAAGYCRFWFDGLALDRQPEARPCTALRGAIPAGARLIVGPGRE